MIECLSQGNLKPKNTQGRSNMEKKLRVFEAFAGIGAQAAALKKLNINF